MARSPPSSILESTRTREGEQKSGGGSTCCHIASTTLAAFSVATLVAFAALTLDFLAMSSRRSLSLASSSYQRNLKYSTTSVGSALSIMKRFKAT